MGLDIRFVKRAAPRVRTQKTKAGIAKKKLRILKGEGQLAEAVLDLSASGLKMVVRTELVKSDALLVELIHPAFHGAIALDAVVRWVRPEGDRWSVGIEFQSLNDRQRRQLDRVIALELGSTVAVSGHGHVGWLARGAVESGMRATLFVYDLDRNERGRIVDEGSQWRATKVRDGGDVEQRRENDLAPLVGWALGLGGTVDIQPPIVR